VSRSADVLIEEFNLFSHMGRPTLPIVERGLGAGIQLTPDKYNMAIEDLNRSMRAYNCLRRSGLVTVGQVLEKSEEELLALRNFGRKSYDELRDKLDEMDLLSADRGEFLEMPELPDALPLSDEEGPIGRRFIVGDDSPILEATPAASAPVEVEAVREPEPEPALQPEPVAVAPAPKKARAKAKATADADAGEGGEEEMPEWKRALLKLTGEEGEGQ